MPIKICSNCHKEHDRNTRYCRACHRRAKLYGDPSSKPGRVSTSPKCSPGVCSAPATQRRAIYIGGTNTNARRSIWLHLCPTCAALFDQEEQRTITHHTPARAPGLAGHIYC